jgi:5'-3' exonuclease
MPSYKSNRVRTEEDILERRDFLRQIDELKTVALPLAGVATISRFSIEADDLVYHAAHMARESYDRIIVVSADADLLQCTLISKNVLVLSPGKNELRGVDYISNEYGIDPLLYVHWRALQGDSSDNILGVAGIGPKTATRLFQKYKSITGIFNAAAGDNPIGTIDGKVGENIKAFGLSNLSANVYVMNLTTDRVGVRLAIFEELSFYERADRKELKKYFMRNAFVSLIDPDVFNSATRLVEPVLDYETTRMPLACGSRHPVEDLS